MFLALKREISLKTLAKTLSYSAIFILFAFIVLFFSVGKYIDVTQKPVESDLIVCLGGGTPERVQKSIALYTEGYSKQQLLLFPGEPYANRNYIRKHNPEIRFVLNPNAKNTADEVRFVKKYMSEHHYDSVIIVSDPPHTRRVKILTDLISVKNDEKFSYVFVSSDVLWWDRDRYWKNPRASHFVKHEILRIPYTYVYYGLLEKVGFEWSNSEYKELKSNMNEFINKF